MKQVIFLLVLSLAVYGKQVVLTLDAPANNITGLAVSSEGGSTSLWAVSSSGKTVYKLHSGTGEVLSSFSCAADDERLMPNGLAYAKGKVYVAQWTGVKKSACRAFQYMPSGEYIGKTSFS